MAIFLFLSHAHQTFEISIESKSGDALHAYTDLFWFCTYLIINLLVCCLDFHDIVFDDFVDHRVNFQLTKETIVTEEKYLHKPIITRVLFEIAIVCL